MRTATTATYMRTKIARDGSGKAARRSNKNLPNPRIKEDVSPEKPRRVFALLSVDFLRFSSLEKSSFM